MHRQIGPGLVPTALGREGLHRVELGAGLVEQAVLHHGHRQAALILQCHMGVGDLLGAGEVAVQIGLGAAEGAGVVRSGDGHAVARGRFKHAVARGQGHGHRVGGIARKGRAAEHDARLAVTQHVELRRNRDRRRTRGRADDPHDLVGNHAREVQVGRIGAALAQGVVTQLAHEHIAVSALAAHQAVLPHHRVQGISTGAARELVVAGAGKQHVVATAAGELVVAQAGDEGHARIALGKGAQVVVAQQVDHPAAALAHLDRVVALVATHVERDRIEQARGVE